LIFLSRGFGRSGSRRFSGARVCHSPQLWFYNTFRVKRATSDLLGLTIIWDLAAILPGPALCRMGSACNPSRNNFRASGDTLP
jgi:hypothetical protein